MKRIFNTKHNKFSVETKEEKLSNSSLCYLMCEREWHDDQTKTEVSEGQGRNEPVLDSVEAVLGGDGDDDQHVPHHHCHHHQRDHHRQQDDLDDMIMIKMMMIIMMIPDG